MSIPVTVEGELAFPSLYLGAADLKGREVTLTIDNVQIDELMMQGGKKQKKPVVYFKGTEKMLVLNKTNAKTVSELYGIEAKQWVGKRVTLYPTQAKMGPKMVPAIRIKDQIPQPKPAGNVPAANAATGTETEGDGNGL